MPIVGPGPASGSQSSRSAVKKFVIDNTLTALPTGITLFKTIATARYEPKVEKLGSTVFCWIGETRRKVSRLSLGRGTGQKLAEWVVDVMVIGTCSDEQNGADQFQSIVDGIAESFEAIVLSPAPTIVDPVDGGASVVLVIGETWSDVVFRPELTADQGRVVFRAIISLPVIEYLSQA